MIAKRSDPWLSATLLVISIATLGRALQVGDGLLVQGTIPWLTIALAACAIGVLVRFPPTRVAYGRSELHVALVACLVWQIVQMLSQSPSGAIRASAEEYARYANGVVGAALIAVAMLICGRRLRHVAFAVLLGAHVLLGTWVIRASPQPEIDVVVFQRDSSETLLRGDNPYAITFPNIYGDNAPWYGPEMSVEGRLQFGYPYMPLTLLLALPGQMLAGDYRYAALLAMTLAAALIAYSRPGFVSFASAALLLLLPRGMFVLERGWSEPFIVLMFALLVFSATRFPSAMPWVLGLYLASKQYVPLAAGTVLLLAGEPFDWKSIVSMLLKATLSAAVVTLPFVLWDPAAFWRSAVTLQLHQPFRWDALSYLAWWMQGDRDLPRAAMLIPFVMLLLATAAVLWRCRRTPAGFAAASALVFFIFFAFNKQAFANYYYFVIGAMCCAVATAPPEQ